MIEIINSESKWVQILVQPLASFMPLGKFLNFSVVRFSHLYHGDYNSTYLIGLGKIKAFNRLSGTWYVHNKG